MIRQIGAHYQEASMTVLEERLHRLETKVETLTDALRVLARGLEGGPMAEPGDRNVVESARRAYDLLLAAGVRDEPGESAPAAPGSRPVPGGRARPGDGPSR